MMEVRLLPADHTARIQLYRLNRDTREITSARLSLQVSKSRVRELEDKP